MQAGLARTVPVAVIVACGCIIATLNFGPRATMGFYLVPISTTNGWGRETFSLALAIQNLLWGIGAMMFGAAADKWGTARVLALGAALYATGLALMPFSTTPGLIYLSAGILVGLGISACSFGIVMGAFSRAVSPAQRPLVFGFATAAGSFGQLLFAPLSQGLIESFGWETSLFVQAGILGLVPLLAIFLRGKPASKAGAGPDQTMIAAVREALGHRSYVLLFMGFFVCGFQIAFITVHFPAYLRDVGLNDPKVGAIALMLIGLFNIAGSLGAGALGVRMNKPKMLAFIYIARSVLYTVFLLIPASPLTVYIFAASLGLLWLSTVPPTNSLVAIMFGTRHFAMLAGVVFFSHQVGSFLGVWLGGILYDFNKSYMPVWWIAIILGVLAALVHLPIREAAAPRLGNPVPAE